MYSMNGQQAGSTLPAAMNIDDVYVQCGSQYIQKERRPQSWHPQEADSVNVEQSAVTISPRLHFCFALHAEDGPATLAWLQHNVLWRSRGLEWIASHPLKNSAPEGHSLPSPTPARAVQLITASAHCEAELAGALDATIVEVLTESLRVPVECYLTCPGPVPLFSGSLGLLTTEPSAAAQCLQEHGMAVLQGALRADGLDVWRSHVEQQIAWAQKLLKDNSTAVVDNAIFTFREIAARGRHRFDLRLDVGPHWQCQQHHLQAVLQSAPWLPVVHEILGEDVVSIISVVYSMPGADAQEWHADGPPCVPGGSAYAVCVFVPLLDLDERTGCTQFWPGSHVHQHLLGFGPAGNVLETTVRAQVAAGSAVLYDYRILHRGLENTCSDGRRDVVQVVYHKPDYTEARNYSTKSLLHA